MKKINSGTILQDRYLIEKQIGEGGMGAVYLAVDQRFDNPVAIKVTFYNDNEFGEAFEREAKILNGLLHPVLPHVSDYFTEGDEHFLVMQYVDGEDAYDILKREGAFPVKDVLRWTDNLLDALDYLHSQEPPIIHRDLKPMNLKITPRGDVFLLDFGLAKLKKENTYSERSVFGYSRKYSPLEQIQGTGTDARSDIFALAATVYHLLTGTSPADAIARASAIVAGRTDPLESASEKNPEIPVGVASVLKIALALNAENRFASAKAMRQAFKHALQGTVWENIASMPENLTIAAGSAPKIVEQSEAEDFPALAAFAEKIEAAPVLAANISADDFEQSDIEAAKTFVEEDSSSDIALSQNLPPAETPTVVRSQTRSFRLLVAALAAVLAIAATVSAYLLLKKESNSEVRQAPTETSAPQAQTETPIIEEKPVETAPEADALRAETNEKSKNASDAVKKNSSKPEVTEQVVAEENAVEKSAPETPRAESKRSVQRSKAPAVKKSESAAQSEAVPDIESIFTGRPGWERDERMRRREERRRMREEMTDEEWREMRRRRRQQRRQTSYPIPF